MKSLVAASIALFVVVQVSGVAAQAKENASDVIVPQVVPTERWFYGWPIVAVGELGAVLTSASLVFPDRLLSTNASTVGFIAGAPTFAMAGPIVHWSHDNFSKGVVSLAANLALPVMSGVVGRSIACSGDGGEECAYHGFGQGFAVAALLLPLADALLLGWEDVPVEETARAPLSKAAAFTVLPSLDVTRTGVVQLGAGGRF